MVKVLTWSMFLYGRCFGVINQKKNKKKKKKEETGKQMNIKEMIEKIESGNKLKTEKKTKETWR